MQVGYGGRYPKPKPNPNPNPNPNLTLTRSFWQIFVAAQRVQSDNLKDVLGIARDSPLYYQMKKVQIDLKEAREQLARFDEGIVA